MSWDDLDVKQPEEIVKESKAKAASLAKSYAFCFSTDSGKAVLDHLVNSFVMSNDTAFSSQNIDYEAAYHNGEAGVVKYILNQIKRAQVL